MPCDVENDSLVHRKIRNVVHTCSPGLRSEKERVWNMFYLPDALIIRPSGNPLTREMFLELISSDDIHWLEDGKLVSIDHIKVFAKGMAAIVVYTMDQNFVYKGIQNHDRARFSATLEKWGSSWRIVHLQRATGQPIPAQK